MLCSHDPKERPSAGYVITLPYMMKQIQNLRDDMQKKLKEKKSKPRSKSPDREAKPVSDLEFKNKTPTERMKLRSTSSIDETEEHKGKARGSWCEGDLDSDEEGDFSTLEVDDVTASLIQTFNQTLCGEPDLEATQ